MTALCKHFVQNTWRKELCSNCFKSREEHESSHAKRTKPMAAVILAQPFKGILRDGKQACRRSATASVHFSAEESQVIGVGGEECVLSDDEDDVESADKEPEGQVSSEAATEQDKELNNLTRCNTEFNMVTENLLGPSNVDAKKTFTQLMLGKPLTDSDGRKKTLLVTVMPFGGSEKETESVPLPIAYSSSRNNVESPTEGKSTNSEEKDGDDVDGKLEDEKSSVNDEVLGNDHINDSGETSKSLFVENNDSSILPLETKRENIQELTYKCMIRDKSEPINGKTSKLPLIKGRVTPDKGKTVIRTPAFNGRGDIETVLGEMLPKLAARKLSETQLKNGTINAANKVNATENVIVPGNVNGRECAIDSLLEATDDKLSKISQISNISSKDRLSDITDKTQQNDDQAFSKNKNMPFKVTFETYAQSNGNEQKLLTNTTDESCANKKNGSDNAIVSKSPTVEPQQSPIQLLKSRNAETMCTTEAGIENTVKRSETNSTERFALLSEPCMEESFIPSTFSTPTRHVSIHEAQNPHLKNVHVGAAVEVKPVEAVSVTFKERELYATSESKKGDDVSFQVKESREMAGEPDGRADSDELSEPPLLPSSPPPALDPRPSFLHGLTQEFRQIGDKPKIPVKSDKVFHASRKQPFEQLFSFIDKPVEQSNLANAPERDVMIEALRTTQKRQAPKPPTTPVMATSWSAFDQTKTPHKEPLPNLACTVGKGEKMCCQHHRHSLSKEITSTRPEPAPRRSLSLSVDSLAMINSTSNDQPPKKKSPNRSKFSLRKFLKIGGSKGVEDESCTTQKAEDEVSLSPSPKPRPEIIHPLELNGTAVEVIGHEEVHLQHSFEYDSLASSEGSGEQMDNGVEATDSYSVKSFKNQPERFSKPAPPPRNHSLDAWYRPNDKLVRAVPAKAAEIRQDQTELQDSIYCHNSSHNNNYANLADLVPGEVRLSLAPSKPQRSVSIKKTGSDSIKRQMSTTSNDLAPNDCDAVEDAVPNTEFSPSSGHRWKTIKLHLRKGRSIIHNNLEDNYDAIVVANHEALAQVLEQLNQSSAIQLPLQEVMAASNLCWSDFSVSENTPGSVVGNRVFYPAKWGSYNITLCLMEDQWHAPNQERTLLAPIIEFSDLVPSHYLHLKDPQENRLVQATIAVHPRLQVSSIKSYGIHIGQKAEGKPPAEQNKDASFALLQLINGLKNLQSQGIEESGLSLSSFVLCREEQDVIPRLCIMESSVTGKKCDLGEEKGSLCQCAVGALKELMPPTTPLFTLIENTLAQERATSLSQVKSLLEFSLWGPTDVVLGLPAAEREKALKRWLDLERATVLHGLVRTKVMLTVFEECHLLFLVRTSARVMCKASFLLDL